MENTKKTKSKFNLFDVTVIIFIALFITGIAYIYFLGSNNSGANVDGSEFEYKLEIEMLDESLGNLIKVGDNVVDNATGNRIGKVVGIVINEYSGSAKVADGNNQQSRNALEGYVNLIITVECNGKADGDTTVITNGCRIMLGSVVEAHTPELTFTANCTMIQPIEKNGEAINNEA